MTDYIEDYLLISLIILNNLPCTLTCDNIEVVRLLQVHEFFSEFLSLQAHPILGQLFHRKSHLMEEGMR